MQLVARHGLLKLEGEKERVDTSKEVLNKLLEIVRSTGRLDLEDVEQAIIDAKNETTEESIQAIDVFQKGIFIKPKTDGQTKYLEAIKKNDLVFCIGPAGTGKTYLAVAMALSYLKSGRIRRIVLARPAVEAGEKLGYLPGDIKAKVNPYLRPLYDAIADMMDVAHVKKYLESDLIEILPLAYMRGRTLNDAFIILDEAQNCTVKQMKTFLTRLGMKSKVVVTGDITQVDLSAGEISGLIDVQERLMNINNISFVYLTKVDIVRHKLVQDIVDAYEL
ncbi:MAG: PhoH family protein [Planctomycetes bacterium]|nr:PhoH family protein [Planctomycetota bacterium]